MNTSQVLVQIAFLLVMVCWFVFAAAFLFRKRPKKGVEQRRNPAFTYGILLQAAGYACVWTFRRTWFTPLFSEDIVVTSLVTGCAVLLAIASVWSVLSAVRHLDKQWSFSARLVEDHQLITSGPYSIVRNPIYAGMFGMLIATGLTISQFIFLLIAIALFFAGTSIRIRSEEALLREAFGDQFNEYTARVPSIFPFVRRKRDVRTGPS